MFPRRDAFGKSVYILTVSRQNIGEAGSTIASSWDIFLRLRVGSHDQDGEPLSIATPTGTLVPLAPEEL
jgi:hypothetical protein